MPKTARNARTPSSGDQPDGALLDAAASVQLCKEGILMVIGTSHQVVMGDMFRPDLFYFFFTTCLVCTGSAPELV
jgi:hypothetical protein